MPITITKSTIATKKPANKSFDPNLDAARLEVEIAESVRILRTAHARGASLLELVVLAKATAQNPKAAATATGGGLVHPACREGEAAESRLDGRSDGRQRPVRTGDVQGRSRLRCVLADAPLGLGVFQGGFCP
jgi:hypothetical protein